MSSLTLRRIIDSLAFWRDEGESSSKYSRRLMEMVQDRALDMEVRLQPYTLDPFDQSNHVIRSKLHIGPLVHLVSQLNSKDQDLDEIICEINCLIKEETFGCPCVSP